MNPPIWPPLSDGIFLAATGMVAAAMLVSSSFTSEHQSRRILGRALERYRSIPEDELAPALENAGKSRFYSLAGIVAVLLCAIDNLGKGAAGSAVQCMNLMCDFDETTALTFSGIYP